MPLAIDPCCLAATHPAAGKAPAVNPDAPSRQKLDDLLEDLKVERSLGIKRPL